VVAPEEEDAIGVQDFECGEEEDGLEGVISAVDVVSQEEVLCSWKLSA
jgi:hypothetical protein